MTDTLNPTETKKPDLYIHPRVLDGRTTRVGPRIGAGWLHKDGVGINIILDAQPIPVDGRIELVGFPHQNENQ